MHGYYTISYYNIIGSESALTAIDAGGETAATPFNIEGSCYALDKINDLSVVYWSIRLNYL